MSLRKLRWGAWPKVSKCATASCCSRFANAYGRSESNLDECTLGELNDLFAKSDGNFQELLVALTTTDAFLYRMHDGASP